MDELKMIMNDNGVFEEYDDTYDITIHCASAEERQQEDGSGNWYLGDCDEEDTCLANDLFVNAWMPLPKQYKGERYGEID